MGKGCVHDAPPVISRQPIRGCAEQTERSIPLFWGSSADMASTSDTVTRRTTDPDLIANRKLIRPSLADIREQLATSRPAAAPALPAAASRAPKKPVPPEQTNAESFYYVKQMQTKTPMVLVLQDGEKIHGIIEWYDRHCLKVHRNGQPNLLVYKANIKYLYKEEDERGQD